MLVTSSVILKIKIIKIPGIYWRTILSQARCSLSHLCSQQSFKGVSVSPHHGGRAEGQKADLPKAAELVSGRSSATLKFMTAAAPSPPTEEIQPGNLNPPLTARQIKEEMILTDFTWLLTERQFVVRDQGGLTVNGRVRKKHSLTLQENTTWACFIPWQVSLINPSSQILFLSSALQWGSPPLRVCNCWLLTA